VTSAGHGPAVSTPGTAVAVRIAMANDKGFAAVLAMTCLLSLHWRLGTGKLALRMP
jgi:hypothetical protein